MKKALNATTLFILVAVMAFLFAGCQRPDSENDEIDLRGSLRITPNSATIGTELTAVYDGIENITYQWKRDSDAVGEDYFKFTPTQAGSYTVTLISPGYKPKTSSPVTISASGGSQSLSGNISVSPASAASPIQLIATYDGTENVTYEWKRNGVNVGANSRYFTANSPGNYTVTVSVFGHNPKTSNIAGVFRSNEAIPVITRSYSADPSARVFGDRLYLYPSRDISPLPATGSKYSMKDRYRVYSTDNMVDWIDHHEILRRDNLPESWGVHYTDATFMWGPDAASRDGRYFFYFPHALGDNTSWEDTWTIGVAWSSNAHGGFRDNEIVRLKDSAGSFILGNRSIGDPCIFQDDDDYYFMVGGNGQFRIAKLKSNMTELDEPLALADMSQLPHFNEGPWMFKRDGKYYLMYSGNASNRIGDELLYAMGDSPKGPWEYKGVILDPVGTGETSQGSIVEFNGKWYLFYHNAKLSRGNGALRSVCVAEVSFNADGAIQRVIPTAAGVAQNGPNLNTASLNTLFGQGNYTVQAKYDDEQSFQQVDFNLLGRITAMDPRVIPHLAVKGTGDISAELGGAIHNLHLSGSYVDFTQLPGTDGGPALIRISYALGGGTVTINARVNNTTTHNVTLPGTGGWGALAESTSVPITLNAGNNNVIRFSGAGVNINSISIFMVAP